MIRTARLAERPVSFGPPVRESAAESGFAVSGEVNASVGETADGVHERLVSAIPDGGKRDDRPRVHFIMHGHNHGLYVTSSGAT